MPADEPPDDEPDRDATSRADDEEPAGVVRGERSVTTAPTATRYSDEPGPVVHEALALDDRHELSRYAQPARDRRGRERIGRGDDRAKHERAPPREVVDERVCDHGHAGGRDGDEADGQQPDRSRGRPQLAKGREEGRAVEERREDAEEDELGVELELRHAGDDPDREAAEDEQDRVRNAQRGGDREHRRHREDEAERDDSVLNVEMHGPIVP